VFVFGQDPITGRVGRIRRAGAKVDGAELRLAQNSLRGVSEEAAAHEDKDDV
jgi:hypothetical protein